MIRFTDLKLPGLKAVSVDGREGDNLILDIRDGYVRANSPYLTITAIGAVEQSAQREPRVRRIEAGLTNLAGLLHPENAGRVTRTVVTPLYRYYCLSDPGRRKLAATEVRLAAGESFAVEPGYFLFVGVGAVRALEQDRTAPAFIESVKAPCIVTAGAQGALALYIKRLPAI